MFSNAKKEASQAVLNSSNNLIGSGTSLEGNVNTTGNIRIDGKVVGSIHTKAKLVLGDTAVVEGNITAQTAEIGGKLQGRIKVAGILILKPTAVVHGDIFTNKLVIAEGAKFNGKCNMGTPSQEHTVANSTTADRSKSSSSVKMPLTHVTLSQKAPQGGTHT
mmetsp:Transcript_17464/g.40602  ORF Transcript_17464/g.40602 Transcript_17464/m.40602 type:complete len:162 (+) Transcript_17464:3666-4151(+)